jgi:sugar phosphate isomerase/epimerase
MRETAPPPRHAPRFAYNTNGFAHHRLEDALDLLAEIGYDGVALTPDVHHLDVLTASAAQVRAIAGRIERHGLEVVVETGGRYVLDPRRKHRPSLLDEEPEAARRLDYLLRCIALARDVGARVVSLWSGAAPEGLGRREVLGRLARNLVRVCQAAGEAGVQVGFEPEPGMAVDRVADWPAVREAVAHPALGLTLDVGHCLATGEGRPEEAIRAHAADLRILHLDDHRPGVHEHLFFGEGEVDFPAVAGALAEVGFGGLLEVELSRHGPTAPQTARSALAFLRGAFGSPAP